MSGFSSGLFATDITAQVSEHHRRAEAQRAIGSDLDTIGTAVEDVPRHTAEAAGAVGRVSADIQVAAAGAEELSASVSEISHAAYNHEYLMVSRRACGC